MGAWAADSFGNDTACDWVFDFLDNGAFSYVVATLDQAFACEDVDSDVGACVLAACEVVARLQGRWGEENEELDAWVKAHPMVPDQAVVAKALAAIDRVTSDASELKELWEDDPEWAGAVAELRQRVALSA